MSAEKPRILCVDDDPDLLSYLRTVLEAEGYEFSGAGSAEEGLRKFKEQTPDLIILDLMMEEVDAGTRFVKDLRLLGGDVPIFMLSSVGDSLNMTTDYTLLGLAGIFQKPIDRAILLQVLEATLAESPESQPA